MRSTRPITPATSPATVHSTLFKKAKNEFSRIRKGILRELSRCKETGRKILITCDALGGRNILSSVEDIYQSGKDEIVVLKWYDGNNLASKTHIFIEEILSIQPLNK